MKRRMVQIRQCPQLPLSKFSDGRFIDAMHRVLTDDDEKTRSSHFVDVIVMAYEIRALIRDLQVTPEMSAWIYNDSPHGKFMRELSNLLQTGEAITDTELPLVPDQMGTKMDEIQAWLKRQQPV